MSLKASSSTQQHQMHSASADELHSNQSPTSAAVRLHIHNIPRFEGQILTLNFHSRDLLLYFLKNNKCLQGRRHAFVYLKKQQENGSVQFDPRVDDLYYLSEKLFLSLEQDCHLRPFYMSDITLPLSSHYFLKVRDLCDVASEKDLPFASDEDKGVIISGRLKDGSISYYMWMKEQEMLHEVEIHKLLRSSEMEVQKICHFEAERQYWAAATYYETHQNSLCKQYGRNSEVTIAYDGSVFGTDEESQQRLEERMDIFSQGGVYRVVLGGEEKKTYKH